MHNLCATRRLEMQKLGVGYRVQWWGAGWGEFLGGLGGVSPWLVRGPQKASIYINIHVKTDIW